MDKNEYTGQWRTVVLSFRGLQRQRIEALQDKLLRLQIELASYKLSDTTEASTGASDKEKEIDESLNAYATALRNYETFSQNFWESVPPGCKFAGTGELAVMVSHYLHARTREFEETLAGKSPDILRPWIPPWLGQMKIGGGGGGGSRTNSQITMQNRRHRDPVSRRIDEAVNEMMTQGCHELDREIREDRERKSASTVRLIMGLFACVSLLAPMLIMALNPKRDVALITTSMATITFAIFIAFGASDSSGKDVLLVTAAYAAVFVVFVGSSLSAP